MVRRYELTKAQWARIEPLLPSENGDADESDKRLFVHGVLWVLRSGVDWKDMPPRYGQWRDVRSRFIRWKGARVWEKVFDVLVRDPSNEYLMFDEELLEAHRQAATREVGPAVEPWRLPPMD